MSPDSKPDEPPNSTGQDEGWFESLKRRKVFRVLVSYGIGAWLVLQIVDVLSGAFPVPDWIPAATVIVLALGFPVAAILSWALQVTPSGIVLDVNIENAASVNRARFVHFLDLVVIGVLLAVVALLSFGQFFPRLASGAEVRVAVLPFENMGDDPTDLYLSEGIADDIRSRLGDIPQLLIAARTSSNVLANNGLDIKTIGDRLTVQHVLEGTVRRFGDQIRIAVQLVDVATGFARWSKTYDSTVDDILALQNNISLNVASEMEVHLTKELRQVLAENPTNHPLAYDYYLQAYRYLNQQRSPGNLDIASSLFRRAIEQDPSFALGFAGLCQTSIARFEITGDTTFIGRAEASCEQALALDANLAKVHTVLGQLYLSVGNLADAKKSFERALSVDPRAESAHAGLGDIFAAQGITQEAEARYNTAIDLQPGNWFAYNRLGAFLVARGRFDEAADSYGRVIELTPDNAHAYNNLGATYYFRGDFAQAARYYNRSLELAPGRAAFSNTGTMYYYAGDFAQAAVMFRNATNEAANDYRLWGNLGDALRFIDNSNSEANESYAEAIRLALMQLDVNPTDATTQTNLAWYYSNTDQAERAVALLTKATESSSSNKDPEREYINALIYALLGDKEKSDESVDDALSLGFPQVIIDATPEFQESARK